MVKKGSITVVMSFMLCVLLSLLATVIQSSQIICSRVQAVNGIDVGLYSLFSEYDRDLLEHYNLFFLDAGYGTEKIKSAQLINHTEYYMRPVLESGLTENRIEACGLDGFRTATDEKGKAVKQQIIRYMKDNIGNAGLERLREKFSANEQIINSQEQIRSQGIQETDIENISPMEEISERNNPLEIVKSIRKNGILGMVLPTDSTLSELKQDEKTVLSNRELQRGLGEFPELDEKASLPDKLCVQEYILEKFGTFTGEKQEGSLDYQIEYILGGKNADKENLTYVVNRLLLMRETANLAYLYTDSQKRAELETCASALSVLLLIPEGMTLIQAALAASWAYIESLSDVRLLLAGEKVPLKKDRASWKTQLSHLNLDNNSSGTTGLDYQEYLRILLSFVSMEKLVLRSMDMIEQNIRHISGRESFSLDACIDAVSMSFQIQGPAGELWEADRVYTYDM